MVIVLVAASLSLLPFAHAGQSAVQTTNAPAQQVQPRDPTAPVVKGTGAIKGKVTTADGGRAMRRVQITLASPDLSEGKTMSTNSQGVFEFTELPAGRYTLTASRAGYLRLQYGQRRPGESGRPLPLTEGQKISSADFSLPRTAALVGRITDEVGDPLPGASIFPMQWKYFRGQRRMVVVSGGGPFNRTDDTGGYRVTGLEPGEYFVMATTRDAWNEEANPKERIGFLPTYSGGTPHPASATRMKVGLGQEVMVPDFALVPGRVGSISGMATNSAGAPLVGQSISLSQEFTGPGMSSSFGAGSTKIAPDGSFTIRNVTPGEYKLSATSAGDEGAEGFVTTVVFGGEDIGGLSVVTSPAGSIRGRVVSDNGEALPTEPRMRVSGRALESQRSFGRPPSPDNGRVQDDMTFELAGMFGPTRVSVLPVPTGWAVKSIDYDGKDLADKPIEVQGGQSITGVTIVLSKGLPELQGTLLDPSGAPAAGTVLLFPDDPEKWIEESRLTRVARPDETGRFVFNKTVPGSYYVVALDYVQNGEWHDPAFLEGLRGQAMRVSVVEGTALAAIALTLKRE